MSTNDTVWNGANNRILNNDDDLEYYNSYRPWKNVVRGKKPRYHKHQ